MPTTDLRDLFLRTQELLLSALRANQPLGTKGAQGSATELDWVHMLRQHLPWRYQVANKAFVVDASGNSSDEIDVVIHDRQYTPLLYARNDSIYIPAEGVYAVFEVRSQLSRSNIEYAGEKAATVRQLLRTSAEIFHATGTARPVPKAILAGILCTSSSWNPPLDEPLKKTLNDLASDQRLDLGCALEDGAFEAVYENGIGVVNVSGSSTALMFLFMQLLERLRPLATATAIEWDVYGEVLADDWREI